MTSRELVPLVTKYEASECACRDCQSLCAHAPCIGTPEDILALVNAGHLNQLRQTEWHAGAESGVPPILMVQLDSNQGACPLFQDGKCTVHPIKPTEGRLASSHHRCHLLESPTLAVALTWLLPRNLKLIRHLLSLV